MLKIVRYGSGNVQAFKNIYNRLNIAAEIVDQPNQLAGATKIVLPGVGAFDQTMDMLESTGFLSALNQSVLEDCVPVLGVCVGMQVLGKSSEEGERPGLGWIDGVVVKVDETNLKSKPRLPHMGWNSIDPLRPSPLLAGIDNKCGFYFLHSYKMECTHQEDVLANTHYGDGFPAAVNRGNIWGFQFHPEKSHGNGVQLLKNFAEHSPC